MKTPLAIAFLSLTATAAFAEPTKQPDPYALDAQPKAKQVAAAPAADHESLQDQDDGWHRPTGRRLLHGFRIGYNFIANYDKPTRENEMSIQGEFKLKTPHSMILGYETFYRIVGHSWLNVVMVGNISVAGLEQSKFIPSASGLIGAEINQSFQLGLGVNLTPDPQSPTHMIAAIGWTPKAGSIYTPLHFYFMPDTEGNHRAGATVGVTW